LCAEGPGSEQRAATAGSWRVLRGGSWGDVVDIEAEDLTFEAFDGHAIEVPYARWRVSLGSTPVRTRSSDRAEHLASRRFRPLQRCDVPEERVQWSPAYAAYSGVVIIDEIVYEPT
jgi:hypothetical protein